MGKSWNGHEDIIKQFIMRFKFKFILKLLILIFLIWMLFIIFFIFHDNCSNSNNNLKLNLNGGFSLLCRLINNINSNNIRIRGEEDGVNQKALTVHIKYGEMGEAVTFPPNQRNEVQKKFEINQFNLMASDLISVNRTLPDYRLPKCQEKLYPTYNFPATSVIIVFHNEAWSTLTRTIWSIINRTPKHLLKEIILVDDASEKDFLGKQLDDYVASIEVSIQVVRMPSRSGLVKARLKGASLAQGSILTFLDSHCECTRGWLEPLLFEIYKNNKTIASPLIDIINDDTFQFVKGANNMWGAFSWTLTFKWYVVSEREMKRRRNDRSETIRTPTIAGGLFSIDRKYFYDIGSYDEGMDVWGAENLEISFRTWMCGGQLLIVPCSHVGHVFRKKTPYLFPGGSDKVIIKNNLRLSEVWLDEWKSFYYAIRPSAHSLSPGNLTSRLELRKRLQCKSFRWYLTNIFPETQFPLDYIFFGRIMKTNGNLCMGISGKKNNESLRMTPCSRLTNQLFLMNKNNAIQNEQFCLTFGSPNKHISISQCRFESINQKWKYDNKTLLISSLVKKMCLTTGEDKLIVPTVCNAHDEKQAWTIQPFTWKT